MSALNAEQQFEDWSAVSRHWQERADTARRYGDRQTERIFLSGVAKAKEQAAEWQARIHGAK
jgi:hypothetical protein